jgi:RNA polymerase sigma-70 factor (ECF subfamily)
MSPSHSRPAEVSTADAATFESVRPRLLAIAGRVLGSTTEADDVVQEAWVRWQGADRRQVRDADSFLATITRRLALNVAQSARARHETSMPAWLAEAIHADADADPALRAERGDVVELGLRLLSERLTPAERAAYVLREAFDYPYREIAQVLGLSEANARQLVTRARLHLAHDRRGEVSPAEQQQLAEVFSAAARAGDLGRLERLLAAAQPRARQARRLTTVRARARARWRPARAGLVARGVG